MGEPWCSCGAVFLWDGESLDLRLFEKGARWFEGQDDNDRDLKILWYQMCSECGGI